MLLLVLLLVLLLLLVMCVLLLIGMAEWIVVLELRNVVAERIHVHHGRCVESISGCRHG